MNWILIIIVATGTRYGGHAITMQEFTSEERCQAAVPMVKFQTRGGFAVCVPK